MIFALAIPLVYRRTVPLDEEEEDEDYDDAWTPEPLWMNEE